MKFDELIADVAEMAGMSKTAAASAIRATFDAIADGLQIGQDTRIPGFGAFSVSAREARKGRNPQTGAEIDIPAKRVAKFSASGALDQRLNPPEPERLVPRRAAGGR